MSYTCRNCGAKSEDANTLCNAAEHDPEATFCGIPEEWVCEDKIPAMKHTCEICGSVAAEPQHLCMPGDLE